MENQYIIGNPCEEKIILSAISFKFKLKEHCRYYLQTKKDGGRIDRRRIISNDLWEDVSPQKSRELLLPFDKVVVKDRTLQKEILFYPLDQKISTIEEVLSETRNRQIYKSHNLFDACEAGKKILSGICLKPGKGFGMFIEEESNPDSYIFSLKNEWFEREVGSAIICELVKIRPGLKSDFTHLLL